MSRYFFRLDDIAPNMNWDNFYKLRGIFEKYGIKPLIAIIPDVQDSKLTHWPENKDFWAIIGELNRNEWIIGQHGYRHLSEGSGGVLKIHKSGEFGSLDLELQKSMISSGKKIIESNLANPEIFIAPRHSFDKNTIEALKINGFNYISDGIALYPFKKWGIIWLPQILWRPRKGLFGMITVALHPNTMTEEDFNSLEKFIEKNPEKIGNFSELMGWYLHAGVFKKFFAFFINLIFKPVWQMAFKLNYGLSR